MTERDEKMIADIERLELAEIISPGFTARAFADDRCGCGHGESWHASGPCEYVDLFCGECACTQYTPNLGANAA